MLHFGKHKPYDDDDDDFGVFEDVDDENCNDNISINILNSNNMKFLKFNWFITLNSKSNQYLISFVNILSVNLEVEEEQRKITWDKNQQKFVEVDNELLSDIDLRTLEGLGEITTETIKHTTLVLETPTRTYRCKLDNKEGQYWYDIFSKNSFFNLASLRDPYITINCDEIVI